jgi:hypothetical protein
MFPRLLKHPCREVLGVGRRGGPRVGVAIDVRPLAFEQVLPGALIALSKAPEFAGLRRRRSELDRGRIGDCGEQRPERKHRGRAGDRRHEPPPDESSSTEVVGAGSPGNAMKRMRWSPLRKSTFQPVSSGSTVYVQPGEGATDATWTTPGPYARVTVPAVATL